MGCIFSRDLQIIDALSRTNTALCEVNHHLRRLEDRAELQDNMYVMETKLDQLSNQIRQMKVACQFPSWLGPGNENHNTETVQLHTVPLQDGTTLSTTTTATATPTTQSPKTRH